MVNKQKNLITILGLKAAQSALLDAVLEETGLKNDAALARTLRINPTSVSKYRSGHAPIGPAVLIGLHELSGIPLRELKSFLPFESKARKAVLIPSSHLHLAKAPAAHEESEKSMHEIVRLCRAVRNNGFAGIAKQEIFLASLALNRFDWIIALGATIPQAIGAVDSKYLPQIAAAGEMLREEELAMLRKHADGS